jgi:ribonuclease J
MNCLALAYGDDTIVIDCGMMFPEDELLGVDSVIPDFTWLESRRDRIRGLFLTHGHEDHIGAVPFFISEFPVPVYGTPFTLGLVERRLDEHELLSEAKLNTVKAGDVVEAGPFKVEFIRVTHSIVQACALAITTPLGVIIHTGDFKIDPTPADNRPFDLHTLAEYGKRGVLLLLSDSTGAETPGFTPSERAVRPRIEDIFRRSRNRVIISCFSSSIHRIQQIMDVGREYGRKVALLGRSMSEVAEIAHNLGELRIPDGILLRPQDIASAPRERTAVIVSGTQGEPMSAMSRVAVDNHKHLSITPGDTVVLSARMIPGNEKGIYRMINHLARRGADIIYGSMNPPVHVSGHGSVEELKLILNLVRPKYFLPVHGEYRQMSVHAGVAEHLNQEWLESTFLLETGETMEIDELGARKAGRVTVGRVCIDSRPAPLVRRRLRATDHRH